MQKGGQGPGLLEDPGLPKQGLSSPFMVDESPGLTEDPSEGGPSPQQATGWWKLLDFLLWGPKPNPSPSDSGAWGRSFSRFEEKQPPLLESQAVNHQERGLPQPHYPCVRRTGAC